MRCFAAVLILLVAAIWSAAPIHAASTNEIAHSKVNLRLPSGVITADLFEPRAGRPRAVVLVLHGAGGMLLDGPEMRRVARHLAADGNAAYVLHYFERTGTLFARDATMQREFGVWLKTVRNSIIAIQESRGTPEPIGIYGYSLGAFLAVAAASDNPRAGAVVEHAGGVWNNRFERIGRLPPLLMVHGELDARVPFAKYVRPSCRSRANIRRCCRRTSSPARDTASRLRP